MVSLNGMTLPSWASHIEDKPAPMPLLLVQAFVDTLDLDLRTDMFARDEQARAWLAEAGLRVPDPGPPGPDFTADLRLAREVRASIRALIGPNTGDRPADRWRPGAAGAGPEPVPPPAGDRGVRPGTAGAGPPATRLADGLLGLLLIIRDAQADGSWTG